MYVLLHISGVVCMCACKYVNVKGTRDDADGDDGDDGS